MEKNYYICNLLFITKNSNIMKKILLFVVCVLVGVVSAKAQVKELSKEMKKEAKADAKKLEKEKWIGAGQDAKIEAAVERCYKYMEDSLNWVVAEAVVKEVDMSQAYARKKAVESATEQATKNCLFKAKEVLKARKLSKKNVGKEHVNVLTLYRDAKKKSDGSEALVRVALKITD